MIKPQTLKGFRDFLPREAKKRQYVINTLKSVFEYFDFEPLETPALEYEEVLLGKYGEEGDKLMYRFKDLGGRKVALRYDQTVPLARVVAQYQNELPMPFKRYQIQPVWRAENPQKGRFREFLQCDADIVGVDSSLADAQAIMVAAIGLNQLGFKKFKILINDRTIFENLSKQTIIAIDKLKKIGRDGVLKELSEKVGLTAEQAEQTLENIKNIKPTTRINEIFDILKTFDMKGAKYEFYPRLARGLDYYTSMIFEIEIEGYPSGSVCGGGRYDDLIGMFAGRKIPAVGFAYGFDRIMEVMEQFNLIPDIPPSTEILVTIFSPEFKDKSLEIAKKLREFGKRTELYLDPNTKLDKQLKYADQKGIPFVVIIGPEEVASGKVTIKNLTTGEQKRVKEEEVASSL